MGASSLGVNRQSFQNIPKTITHLIFSEVTKYFRWMWPKYMYHKEHIKKYSIIYINNKRVDFDNYEDFYQTFPKSQIIF